MKKALSNCLCLCLTVFLFLGMENRLPAQNMGGERYNLAVYATGLQDGRQISDDIKNVAQNTASTKLTGGGNYQLIERSNEFLKQIEEEKKFQQSGDVADNQIAELGASYGAQKICVISITIAGKYLYIAARIVDVATKTSFESGDADIEGYSGIAQIRPTVIKAIEPILEKARTASPAISYSTDRSTPAGNINSSDNRGVTTHNNGKNKEFKVGDVSFLMVFVEGGTFQMGSSVKDEKPVHPVTVSDFYIGEFEVTQALWIEMMGTNGVPLYDQDNTPPKSKTGQVQSIGFGANYPIFNIKYSDAVEFCRLLNQRFYGQLPTGYSFALPTEAEWEYAAKGGNMTNNNNYSGSNNLWEVGWFCKNNCACAQTVGLMKPNELGIYDMCGNVCEWCADWYGNYNPFAQTNPTGPLSGWKRVRRGGCWADNEESCRVTKRDSNTPDWHDNRIGFRIVLVRR